MKTSVLAGACAAILLAASAASVQAQPAPDAPGGMGMGGMGPGQMMRATTLNISAFGEVKLAPDMATISLGVQSVAPTAADAMAQNARHMSQVVGALRKAGIDGKDIQTSGLNLNAQYDYEQNKPPKLTGYQASNEVTVTVNDLGRLGPTLDSVVAVGANQINGVTFGLKDPQAASDAARLKAVQALQAKAQLYAGATGFKTGRLINLSEGGGYSPPRPLPMASFRMAAEAAPSTPVEPGQLSVRVDLNGFYELVK